MIINGKNYRIPEISFDTVCQLEEVGLSLFDLTNTKILKKKFTTIIRAFTCLATGLEAPEASELIQQHLLGGGTFDGWMDEILKAVETSGFFQAMTRKAEKKSKSPNTSEEVIGNE